MGTAAAAAVAVPLKRSWIAADERRPKRDYATCRDASAARYRAGPAVNSGMSARDGRAAEGLRLR